MAININNTTLSKRVVKEKEELLSATPRIEIDRLKFRRQRGLQNFSTGFALKGKSLSITTRLWEL